MWPFKDTKKKRNYEGAAKTKRVRNWKTPATSADTAIKNSLATLRNRSRDLIRNNPHAAKGVDVLVNNIVGRGVVGTIKSPDKAAEKRLNDAWKSWATSKQADFYGLQTFAGLQRLVMRSALEGGDVLVRSMTKTSGFPLEFQVLEGDHLPLNDNRTLTGGGRIVNGIEFNDQKKRIAYHIYKDHPGDSGIFNSLEMVRVEAREIAHVFRVDRPGQNRGIPVAAPVIIKLNDLGDYGDAQLLRQKIAASWAVFVEDIEGADLADDEEEIELLEKVEPGMIELLPAGKKVSFANPPGVDGYEEFNRVELRAVAAGFGVTYESLTNDYSNVNFSSGRMGWIEMGRTIDTYQYLVLKPMFLDFAAKEFLRYSFLQGENVNGARFVWTFPRREMIDPTKEVPAAIKGIRSGITTLQEQIRKSGRDPEEQFQEIKETNDTLDKLGLVLDSDPRKMTLTGKAQDSKSSETPEDIPEDDSEDDNDEE